MKHTVKDVFEIAQQRLQQHGVDKVESGRFQALQHDPSAIVDQSKVDYLVDALIKDTLFINNISH